MLKIRFSHTAEQQLEEIWIYTLSEWSENQANRYVSEIEDAFKCLLDNPLIGKARPEIDIGLRSFAVQKHIVYYRVCETFIEIIGILHCHMDVANFFD